METAQVIQIQTTVLCVLGQTAQAKLHAADAFFFFFFHIQTLKALTCRQCMSRDKAGIKKNN